MLRNSRAREIDVASSAGDCKLVQNTPTYSHAFVSTMHSSNGQHGGGIKNAQNKKVFVGVTTVSLLLVVFVAAGSYMDSHIHNYNEQENTEHDYQTHLALLGLQLALNVILLVVPYFALCKYDSDGYVCQYYYVVGALWVLALHAQPHLKDRFYVLLSSDITDTSTTNTIGDNVINNDTDIIAKHVLDAQKNEHMSHEPETENLQYRANPKPFMAPQLRPTRDEPVQFSSVDLLPQATTQQHQHQQPHSHRGTNVADLI